MKENYRRWEKFTEITSIATERVNERERHTKRLAGRSHIHTTTHMDRERLRLHTSKYCAFSILKAIEYEEL